MVAERRTGAAAAEPLQDWNRRLARLLTAANQLPPVSFAIRPPGSKLLVRMIRAAEAEAAHATMREAFRQYIGVLDPVPKAAVITLDEVREALGEGGGILGLVEGEVAATSLFRVEPDRLYIGRLSVLPRFRGRGIATALLDYMEMAAATLELPRARLGTRQSMPMNVALYERHGYRVVERHPQPSGCDEVLYMEKRVSVKGGNGAAG